MFMANRVLPGSQLVFFRHISPDISPASYCVGGSGHSDDTFLVFRPHRVSTRCRPEDFGDPNRFHRLVTKAGETSGLVLISGREKRIPVVVPPMLFQNSSGRLSRQGFYKVLTHENVGESVRA